MKTSTKITGMVFGFGFIACCALSGLWYLGTFNESKAFGDFSPKVEKRDISKKALKPAPKQEVSQGFEVKGNIEVSIEE